MGKKAGVLVRIPPDDKAILARESKRTGIEQGELAGRLIRRAYSGDLVKFFPPCQTEASIDRHRESVGSIIESIQFSMEEIVYALSKLKTRMDRSGEDQRTEMPGAGSNAPSGVGETDDRGGS